MEERIDKDLDELSYETFLEVYNILKRKEGGKYDFIIKGGESLLCALYNLFRVIWKTEQIPLEWKNSVLTQLHKRGHVSLLSNYRFIHEKDVFCKYFSQIVMSFAKPILFENLPVSNSQ